MFSRVSFLDKLFFTKHLGIMLKSGIPISEALESLRDQARNPAFRKILDGVLTDAQRGKSLKEALSKYPKVFDPLYLSLVRIGEHSGNLEKSLKHLSEQLEKEQDFRKKVQSAMFYPLLVFVATTFLGGGVSLFILPKLVEFFESLDVELPLTTKILLFAARIMKNYGILIFLGFIALLLLFIFLIKLPLIKPLWHRFLLRLPILGSFLGCSQLSSFCRNLGIMLESGIPITEALEISAGALGNEVFKADVEKIGRAVEKGERIEEALEKGKFFEFPSVLAKMVGVGEQTGHLEENLLYLGDFFEEEVDSMSKNFANILEPVLLLGIGLVVGFVALAIISPIYQLTGSIRR